MKFTIIFYGGTKVYIKKKLENIEYPHEDIFGAKFAPPVYICKKAIQKPCIDGNIDKPFWAHANEITDFVDIMGKSKPKPSKQTYAKFLWDKDNLYIAAKLYDDEIWAYIDERDEVIFYDNDFEFFLDRECSTHNYFELEINAKNVIWDLFLTKPYRDGGIAIDGFDFQGMISAVKIEGELNNPQADNKYWSVEIMIPWKGIARNNRWGEPPKPEDYYRFNLSRVQWQVDKNYKKAINPKNKMPFMEDNWVLSPTGVVNIHYPESWAFLVFEGDETISFDIPEEEKIRWELRKVYYDQREYYVCNNEYLKKLDKKFKYDIKIETTMSTFHAYVEYDDKRISIIQDGYTWIEKID